MNPVRLEQTFGRQAADQLDLAGDPGPAGAVAALESFYYAFNQADLDVFRRVWLPDPLIRLGNPLGGLLEGLEPIVELYRGIFEGPARVWVEFHDIVAYPSPEMAVFSGRERGEFATGDTTVPLDIRTTRCLQYRDGRWGQVHHHGSITDTDLLTAYRAAVRS